MQPVPAEFKIVCGHDLAMFAVRHSFCIRGWYAWHPSLANKHHWVVYSRFAVASTHETESEGM